MTEIIRKIDNLSDLPPSPYPDGVYAKRFRYDLLPDHLTSSLILYATRGVPTGGALRALLQNDLRGCLERSDETTMEFIVIIVSWAYQFLPSPCWGSVEKVDEWLRDGGYEGRYGEMAARQFSDTLTATL